MNITTPWSVKAWQAAAPIYEAITAHPFVKELAAGTLPLEKFEFYLGQDALYLDQYAAALSHIASRLDDKLHVETFINFARDGIEVEKAMHEVFLSRLATRPANPTPSCMLYTSVIAAQRHRPVEVEAAAVLPCFWIYQKVGNYIVNQQKDIAQNPYKTWISTYADPAFDISTHKAIDICNQLAANASPYVIQAMTQIFILCSKMEWMFWDSAYNLEKWKI